MRIGFLTILSLLLSCSGKPEHDFNCTTTKHHEIVYKVVDTLKIENDISLSFNDLTTIKSQDSIVFFSSQEAKKIYGLNLKNNNIIYDFDYNALSVPIQDFYVTDNKTTYLLSDYPYNLLAFVDGQAKPEIIFSGQKGINGRTSGFNGDQLFINEKRQEFTMLMFQNNESNYTDHILKTFHLKERITTSFCKLPESFEENTYPLLDHPSKIDQDTITYVSFGNQHVIEKYNNQTGELIEQICAQSSYIEHPIQPIPKKDGIEFQEEANFIITQPFYLGLYYDEYRDIYYRIVKHKQQLKDDEFKLNSRYDGDWSIIILDKNFNTIGETKMPQNKYHYYSCFVAEKGFYIHMKDESNNNVFTAIKFIINEDV